MLKAVLSSGELLWAEMRCVAAVSAPGLLSVASNLFPYLEIARLSERSVSKVQMVT